VKGVKPTTTNRSSLIVSLSCDRFSFPSILLDFISVFLLTCIVVMSQRFSAADVASHKTASDLYIIVDEDVYDLTKFQDEHPGGKKSMYTTT
jgi:cytochrome b involved in lipid metabolism